MPLDPVIPVSTLRVWRGSHRDRARGRDDTPRGMRRRMRVTRTRSRSRRRSPCQGVRLNMRGGLGITAWRAMWPLWLHTRTRSRSREGEGIDPRHVAVRPGEAEGVAGHANANAFAMSSGIAEASANAFAFAAGRPSTHGRTGRRGTAGGASANAFAFAVGVPAGVAVAPRDPELPRTRSRSRALSSRARDAGVGATTGVV